MSSSASWYSSLECSSSIIDSSGDSSFISTAIQWLRFIFLSPCPQRLLFSSIDLIFLFTLVVLAITRFIISRKYKSSSVNKPLLERERPPFRVTAWFYVSLIVTALLALAYTSLSILTFVKGVSTKWDVVEAVFRSLQAVTHIAVFVVIAHGKRFGAAYHSVPIRVYWGGNLLVVSLFVASGVVRLVNLGYEKDSRIRVDDLFFLASFPLSVYLFVVTIRGSTGLVREENVGKSSLHGNGSVELDSNVSGYATASLFSKAVWKWMNPLLTKGCKSPLTADEVPSLPPDFRAERMAELLEKNLPKPEENSNHPVFKALIRCFWKQIVLTGVLAAVRLGVMYIGPLLIDSFVAYASGDRSNPLRGYSLVLTLLVAKLAEVLSSHQLSFHTTKLGMLMRCSLITTLYNKGLRLSCSARQTHGVGEIVNYMAVDSQIISDMMPQMHSVWMMPMQLAAAIVLLYMYIGMPVVAAVGACFLLVIFTFGITLVGNMYQFNLMENRDEKMKAINEMMGNMRVIKFQAWEEHFIKKIQSVRETEFGWLRKIMYMMAWNGSVLWSIPNIISCLTFTVAVLMKVNLTAGRIFTALTILKILQDPVRSFPQVLVFLNQTMISLRRLNGYMKSHELERKLVERGDGCGGIVAVEVKNGSFSWDENDEKKVLKDVNFSIRKGELVAIVGTVGSGKSTLLASVLGELHKSSGEVRVFGTTAYVAQSSWIQNATIQDNILFGSPMDRDRYNKAIRVCSLEKDLEVLEHGDQTEIGERGINLSGGQKQRIQLARAVYQDCDIYLLDDVFSAVDAQTGSEIFKGCVRGVLKDKTILLVTHQVDFLHNADLILVMREGKIVQSGKYGELLESGLDFGALVAAHENSMELVEMSATVSNENCPQTPKSPGQQTTPNSPIRLEGQEKPKDQPEPNANANLIEDEERECGHVSGKVYKEYCTEAYGWWGVVAVIVSSLLWQLALTANDYWLAYETSSSTHFRPNLFIILYGVVGVGGCILVAIRSFFVTILGLKTCQILFAQIIDSILHAPMSFFDITPSGRILSRVSTDQSIVDFMLPMFMSTTLASIFTVVGILFVMCQNAWPTIFLIIPLIWLNIWYRKYFIASSRELTRLDSITKAPILHHFSETISGVMTIRSFRKESSLFQGNIDRVNKSLRMDFHNNGANEWFGFRLEFIGCFLLCMSTLFMVMLPKRIIGSEYIGMALSYGLSLNSVIFYCVYLTCTLENKMVSVERIKQFINIPSEAKWKIPESAPPPNWPFHGDIEIKDLKVRYRHNTPLVLKGISLGIHGGEKIGIVGRTGSGKSTLIQVFFRLVEPSEGTIVIDGIDICKLGLHDLRSRFGIIPQEPVLFEGTVRSNIDPLGLYSDDEIWRSLERCQLKDVVSAKPGQLDASVTTSGDNWSVGQRQLLCLGRVMLKNSRILFMDEATASVDSQTDAVIQKVIREDFLNCTIITIAHRIPTVIDCNRVLVVDDGFAKEFEAPSKLLERPSLFGALVQEYQLRSSGV